MPVAMAGRVSGVVPGLVPVGLNRCRSRVSLIGVGAARWGAGQTLGKGEKSGNQHVFQVSTGLTVCRLPARRERGAAGAGNRL